MRVGQPQSHGQEAAVCCLATLIEVEAKQVKAGDDAEASDTEKTSSTGALRGASLSMEMHATLQARSCQKFLGYSSMHSKSLQRETEHENAAQIIEPRSRLPAPSERRPRLLGYTPVRAGVECFAEAVSSPLYTICVGKRCQSMMRNNI